MKRLRKSLAYLLMFCLIGYGSAWAYEGHAINLENHDSISVQLDVLGDEHAGDQKSANNDACDHCCHALSHLLAVCLQTGNSFSPITSSASLAYTQNFISLIVSPDLRPPRV